MLLKIIIFLVVCSILSNIFFKYKKIFFVISILFVVASYLFLSLAFFHTESFYPNKSVKYYYSCCNYYNFLVDSFKKYKLNFLTDDLPEGRQWEDYFYIYDDGLKLKLPLLDTSVYKNKIYLYFGITPILLFYLPFNLITGLYLTDKFIVFVLSFFIFLISLFVLKKVLESVTEIKNISSNIIMLSIFLIGFCNLLPFLVIRSAIYEVAITTAAFLLLVSFCLFYYYINTKNLKNKNISNFCLSLTLCLTVGARPSYVFLIPIFFFFVVWLNYKETNSFKTIINSVLIFLVPCLIYGIIIALYNYFRFDSIFEFGWKYQLNYVNKTEFVFTIKDFIIGLRNNLFILPDVNEHTIFSLANTSGHMVANEKIVGFIWICPIVFMLFFIPHFLKQIYKINRKTFVFLLVMILVIIVNVIVLNSFGMVVRYIFEYLSLMVILSFVIFLFYICRTEDKLLKRFLNVLFILVFIYSFFINISLLFCKENAIYYITDEQSSENYRKIIRFL